MWHNKNTHSKFPLLVRQTRVKFCLDQKGVRDLQLPKECSLFNSTFETCQYSIILLTLKLGQSSSIEQGYQDGNIVFFIILALGSTISNQIILYESQGLHNFCRTITRDHIFINNNLARKLNSLEVYPLAFQFRSIDHVFISFWALF